MDQQTNPYRSLLFLLAGIILFLFLLRTGLVFRLFNLFLFLLLAGGVVLAVSLMKKWRERRQAHFLKTTPEGQVQDRINYCRSNLQKIEEEIQSIRKDIEDLRKNLERSVDEEDQAQNRQLITAFETELELRQAKKNFFETCATKLEALLNKYQVGQKLAAKKDKLQELREEHYEDLAEMEALRSDVEMDVFLLEDLDVLSLKTLESNSLDGINRLKNELEAMTRNLKDDQ